MATVSEALGRAAVFAGLTAVRDMGSFRRRRGSFLQANQPIAARGSTCCAVYWQFLLEQAWPHVALSHGQQR